MKKYAGTKTVFNFCSRYNDYEGFNKNLNIGLKTVGKAVGISDLEFYQAIRFALTPHTPSITTQE